MAYRKSLLWLGLVAAIVSAPGAAHAQSNGLLYEVPGANELEVPLPIGNTRMEEGGFYTAAEFVFFKQTRSLGSQTVAYRGVFDMTGNIGEALGLTQFPTGRFIGVAQNGVGTVFGRSPVNSAVEALNTDDTGRGTYQPGFNVTTGYRFRDGTAIYASYMHLFDAAYSAGATTIAPGYALGNNLLGSFLSSGVVNFPNQYNGPVGVSVPGRLDAGDTPIDRPFPVGDILIARQPIVIIQPNGQVIVIPLPPERIIVTDQTPGNTVGIWNAADVMDIRFTQRYDQVVLGSRLPLFDTEYSRVYGLAGGKMSWFWENFWWRTTDYDIAGNTRPEWAAEYTNTLSQRMYGPYLGCGHEVYLGTGFALSLDLSAGLLLDVVKQRVKYERADIATQAKRSQLDYALVPNLDANLNVSWYPLAGVQMKLGYNAMGFFNTWRMDQPIGFNFGAIDPVYDRGYFRFMQGFNVGLGLSF